MKILYFTPYYPPQSEAAATRSYWFIKTLREAGHEVRVLTQENFGFRLASNKSGALKRLLAEHLMGIELFLRVLLSSQKSVVLSSPPFFSVVWGALAAILRGKKLILDVRDLYPDVFFEMGLIKRDSLLGKVAIKLTYFVYERSHAVITVTQGLVKEIQKLGVKNVSLIMNGYDSRLFSPDSTVKKFEKFSLVFHGNLGKVQNIETMLKLAETLEHHSDIEFVVAGEGPKSEEIIRAKKKNIRFVGNIPYSEIPELLRQCHVGLSFRTDDKIGKEAFPVKVFEYIGVGLPVIMAPKGEAGDLLEDRGLGRQFENQEIQAMTQEILKLKYENKARPGYLELSRENSSKKILTLLPKT